MMGQKAYKIDFLIHKLRVGLRNEISKLIVFSGRSFLYLALE